MNAGQNIKLKKRMRSKRSEKKTEFSYYYITSSILSAPIILSVCLNSVRFRITNFRIIDSCRLLENNVRSANVLISVILGLFGYKMTILNIYKKDRW